MAFEMYLSTTVNNGISNRNSQVFFFPNKSTLSPCFLLGLMHSPLDSTPDYSTILAIFSSRFQTCGNLFSLVSNMYFLLIWELGLVFLFPNQLSST